MFDKCIGRGNEIIGHVLPHHWRDLVSPTRAATTDLAPISQFLPGPRVSLQYRPVTAAEHVLRLTGNTCDTLPSPRLASPTHLRAQFTSYSCFVMSGAGDSGVMDLLELESKVVSGESNVWLCYCVMC